VGDGAAAVLVAVGLVFLMNGSAAAKGVHLAANEIRPSEDCVAREPIHIETERSGQLVAIVI